MSGEFDVEVRNAIRALRTEVESLTKSQSKLNDEVRRYAQQAHDAFNKRLELPVEETEKFGKAAHELGHALRYLGGPLAEISHKLTGGAGLSGGLAAIAVSAGAASLAIEAFSGFIDHQVDDLKRAIEAEDEYIAAIEKGREVQNRQAEAGLQQAGNHRKLLAAGGPEAVSAAAALSKRLAGVVKPEDVEGATAAIYGKYGNTARARGTLDQVGNLALTGSFSATEAANELLKAGGNPNDYASSQHVAAMLYQRKTGRVGNADSLYSAALANVSGDPLLGAAARSGNFDLNTRNSQGQNAIDDNGNVAAGKSAAAADPQLNALLELHNKHERQIAVLERMEKAQGFWSWAKSSLGWWGGGEGSAATQVDRMRRIFSEQENGAGAVLNPEK